MRKFIKLLFILQDKLEDDKSTTLLSLKAENSKGSGGRLEETESKVRCKELGLPFSFATGGTFAQRGRKSDGYLTHSRNKLVI